MLFYFYLFFFILFFILYSFLLIISLILQYTINPFEGFTQTSTISSLFVFLAPLGPLHPMPPDGRMSWTNPTHAEGCPAPKLFFLNHCWSGGPLTFSWRSLHGETSGFYPLSVLSFYLSFTKNCYLVFKPLFIFSKEWILPHFFNNGTSWVLTLNGESHKQSFFKVCTPETHFLTLL